MKGVTPVRSLSALRLTVTTAVKERLCTATEAQGSQQQINRQHFKVTDKIKSTWDWFYVTCEVQYKTHHWLLLLKTSFPSFSFHKSVQSLSRVRLFATPWTAAYQDSLSITNSRSLLKLMSIESVMPSNHLIFCRPLLLPSIFPSIRVFSDESVLCIRWPKCWSFSFSISPSNEYSALISFRMGGLDLLAVQGTLKSLLQHHSSKVSILWCSAFFIVQLSMDLCQQSNVSAF